MSENEVESASKRPKLCDQEKAGDDPALMREDQSAASRSRDSSPIAHAEFQSSILVLQMNEDDEVDSKLMGSMRPDGSGSQCGQESNQFVIRLAITRQI